MLYECLMAIKLCSTFNIVQRPSESFTLQYYSTVYPNMFKPLGPNSHENEVSLHIITTCSNIQVMRIKNVITKDKMS